MIFFQLVSPIWSKEIRGSTSLQKWQNKIRRLRQVLMGWAKDMNRAYKKEKHELLRKADELDNKIENKLRSPQELDLKQCIKDRWLNYWEEEIKWFQRVKTTKLLEGDRNSKYFRLVANGKWSKPRIFRLEHEGVIEGEDSLKRYITNYYKDLLSSPERSNSSLIESRI